MSRQSRGDDLAESVSTFGDDLADLPDSELAERADAYLSRVESRHEGRAEAYLRESEAWYKRQADAYLGFDRGDVEVDRGDD